MEICGWPVNDVASELKVSIPSWTGILAKKHRATGSTCGLFFTRSGDNELSMDG